MNEMIKSKIFQMSHEIAKRNVFARNYKKTALKKAWMIVKWQKMIYDKCIKLSKDYNITNQEKRSNLKSIQAYFDTLYELMNKYNILNTHQEIFLLDMIYNISTVIYEDNYNDYNDLLKSIPLRMKDDKII